MKKIYALLLAGFILTAFTTPVSNNNLPGEHNELTGYRVNNNYVDHGDFNLWVITEEDSFNSLFQPLHDSVLRPDFEKQLIIAALVETINYSYRVSYTRLSQKKDVLNVYFTVSKKGPVAEIKAEPSILALSKIKGLRAISFWHGDMLVKTIPIRQTA